MLKKLLFDIENNITLLFDNTYFSIFQIKNNQSEGEKKRQALAHSYIHRYIHVSRH